MDRSFIVNRCRRRYFFSDIFGNKFCDVLGLSFGLGLSLSLGFGFGDGYGLLPAATLTTTAAGGIWVEIVAFHAIRVTGDEIFHHFTALIDTALVRTDSIIAQRAAFSFAIYLFSLVRHAPLGP